MMEIVGILFYAGLIGYIYFTLPPEDSEIIEARKLYGKATNVHI